MAIIHGARRAKLEAKLVDLLDADTLRRRGGTPIPPLVLEAEPLANLIHICREPTPRKVGIIEVPDSVRDEYPLNIGWIVAAGPERSRFDGTADELLGLKVMWGQYGGTPIHADFSGTRYFFGDFITIAEDAILAVLPDDLGLHELTLVPPAA